MNITPVLIATNITDLHTHTAQNDYSTLTSITTTIYSTNATAVAVQFPDKKQAFKNHTITTHKQIMSRYIKNKITVFQLHKDKLT